MFKVLLVDDEPVILSGLKRLICWQEFGFSDIDAATGADEAFDMLTRTHYDVLITDIRMDGKSGLDLLRELHDANISLRSIILSSYNSFEYVKEALQYGIENYLLKPVDEDELRSTLSQVIEKIDRQRKNSYVSHVKESAMLENTLELWMKGESSAELLTERLAFYGIDPNYNNYAAGVVFKLEKDDPNEQAYELREGIVRQLIPMYKKEGSRLIAVWTINGYLLITQCSNEDIDAETFQQTAQKIADMCCRMDGEKWRCVTGAPVAHISKIFESYRTCIRQISVCQILDDETVPMHQVTKDIIRDLHQDCAAPYSLKTLATKYNLSQAYLGRLFKIETGSLFTDYLRNIRLEEAKKLLEQTDRKSWEIATATGFQNQNYFSNVFKKYVGMYPSVYRIKYLQAREE